MALAFEFSAAQGLCSAADAAWVRDHLTACGLPVDAGAAGANDATRLVNHMRQDKTMAAGKLAFILACGIGRAFVVRDVDPAAVERFLAARLCKG